MRSILLVVLVGCGGQGGNLAFDPNTPVADLTAEQRVALCDAAVAVNGESNEAQCSSDTFVEVGLLTQESCLDSLAGVPPECAATAQDYLACNEDISMMTDAQICSSFTPSSCQPLLCD